MSPLPAKPSAGRRPIEKFARVAGQCTQEASVYGKCILNDYNHITKDKCLTEFLKMKQCFTAAYKKL